jgi:hypothetical protein
MRSYILRLDSTTPLSSREPGSGASEEGGQVQGAGGAQGGGGGGGVVGGGGEVVLSLELLSDKTDQE